MLVLPSLRIEQFFYITIVYNFASEIYSVLIYYIRL